LELLSATCPLCGEEISFEAGVNECHCVHCGSKLLTSALISERVETPGENGDSEPQLTEEEKAYELERKARFKEELHAAVKQIDELHDRRKVFKTRRKTAKALVGVGLACILFALLVLFTPGEDSLFSFVAAGILGAVAVVILIVSAATRSDVIKQEEKLEKTIAAKKEERDILIGRLNKINKKLHIHRSK
jgi:hypothetical protein